MRGFFLADPEDLSLLVFVDQFSSDDWPSRMYRVAGGNDRIATTMAARLGDRVRLETEVVAVSQRGSTVRVSARDRSGDSQLTCDYLLMALHASIVRRVPITPALPVPQHEAFAHLRYGRATKTLMQFSKRFWRIPGKPRAFDSPLPFGAVWEGNEDQRGAAGIITLLAGGNASDLTQAIIAKDGPNGLVRDLEWLGSNRANLIASRQIVWEQDPFARGGYAYFDPAFDPGLRSWLARPAGRIFFAGEHTSIKWQGYMNGAVESGLRAAAEIAAVHQALPASEART